MKGQIIAILKDLEQGKISADTAESLIEEAMPTKVTDDEIKAMALKFAPVCIYDDDYEDVNRSIREDVITLLTNLRNRVVGIHPIFKNHGTQINDADDEHPTNKEKFDGNHLPDTDENR